MLTDPRPTCVCGCPAEVHEHFRAGDDCGRCTDCHAYQRPRVPLLEQLRAAVRRWRVRPA